MPLQITNRPGTLHNFVLGWFTLQRRNGQLILDPPFQRGSVWTPDQQAAFIETLLDDMPCPAIFACEYMGGPLADKAIIIDGKQRLEAVFAFMDGTLTVRGERFPEQEQRFQNQFSTKVTIPTVLLRDTPMRECAALYVKLLKAGTAHTEAEIRQAEQLLAQDAFD